jgi:hypothetical protein
MCVFYRRTMRKRERLEIRLFCAHLEICQRRGSPRRPRMSCLSCQLLAQHTRGFSENYKFDHSRLNIFITKKSRNCVSIPGSMDILNLFCCLHATGFQSVVEYLHDYFIWFVYCEIL